MSNNGSALALMNCFVMVCDSHTGHGDKILVDINEKAIESLDVAHCQQMYGRNERLRRLSQDGQTLHTRQRSRFQRSGFAHISQLYEMIVNKYMCFNVLIMSQKRHRGHRDTMRENVVKRLRDHVEEHPNEAVNFREIFESELFGLALKQVSRFILASLSSTNLNIWLLM